jgi:superfamily II DNA or RNA helicase
MDLQVDPVATSAPSSVYVLRPYQSRIIDEWRRARELHRHIVIMAATGAGKTEIAIAIAEEILSHGNRVIFVAPALSLIDQTVERFYARGLCDVGVMQANHPMTNPARMIQVCSEQTLRRREVPQAGLVIVDECHRQSTFINEWLVDPEWTDVPFLGLSATPWASGMARRWDHLIIGATTKELIDIGFLSDFRVYAPSSPDLRDVRVRAGDYVDSDLSKVMDQDGLVGNVVETWIEKAEGRPTLCFAVDRAHAMHLKQQFERAGVPAGYIDCFIKRDQRQEIADDLHAGRAKVVVNVGCLTTGIDWDVRCIILARPTKSEMLFVQMIGRGLRTAEGKPDCLILDHSDNHVRLGFVTDIVHDHLDDGKPKLKTAAVQRDKLPKPCPQCKFLKPVKVLQCPACGFLPVPKSAIEHEAGELIELKSRFAAHELTQDQRLDFYLQLRHVEVARKYSSKWAAVSYKTRLGHWPPWAWNNLAPREPAPSTLAWVKSRQIAYAKSRRSA